MINPPAGRSGMPTRLWRAFRLWSKIVFRKWHGVIINPIDAWEIAWNIHKDWH